MQIRKDFDPFVRGLICISVLSLLIKGTIGGEFSEFKPFWTFIQSIDPENVLGIDWNGLVPHPCWHQWEGVKCSLRMNTITEIRLENMNLSGIIDADSLCKLSDLRVVSLARNHIHGVIPDTISSCRNLRYLDLSSNLLNASAPFALSKLKNLRKLDISNNPLKDGFKISKETTETRRSLVDDAAAPTSENSTKQDNGGKQKDWGWALWLPLVLVIAFFVLLATFVNLKAAKSANDKKILKALAQSPPKPPLVKAAEEDVKAEEKTPDLVFFVGEEERFRLDDLLEAGADLQSQSFCSSLYKVQLKNNAIYAVKRLKKLKGSLEEFGQTMRKVGEMKHANILPLVAYSSTFEERLLIYKYQRKGSLFSVLESYIEGKREFPWKQRLSIAVGIARGLDCIYKRSDDLEEVIPHGNIKLSNILLNENEEPQISEYGYSKFIDPKTAFFNSNRGYTAPEKALSEQADVFSFGVILLELLTGKLVEKSGLDLPKWVKAMVREEWTGEVFDKEVAKVGMYAFPLLNVSLKCVAHFAENRPAMAEVLEKIEEVVNAQHDYTPSVTSAESSPQDGRLLHSVAEESLDDYSAGSTQ